MSDPLQQAAAFAEQTRRRNLEGGTNPLDEATAKVGQVQEYRQQQREQFPELPGGAGWEYDDYVNNILPAIQSSKDPEATRERFNSAKLLSSMTGKSLGDTFLNLETEFEEWTGKAFMPKTAARAIIDSYNLGIAAMEHNSLGAKLKAAGGSDPEIEAKLAENYKKMMALQDNMPRSWGVDAVKFAAQSLPYTATAIAAGAGSGALVTMALGPEAGIVAAIKSAATVIGSGIASYAMMEGAEYADLRSKGVRHDIAAPASTLSAILQAAIEVGLGNVAGASTKLLGSKVPTITGNIVKRLSVSGRIGTLARSMMGFTGEAIEEGAEEGLQSLTSSIALDISGQLQKEGGVDTETADQIAKTAAENFKGGFLASLILGVPGSVVEYRGNAVESRRVSELARTFDEKTFTEQAGSMNLSMFEGMDETKKAEALKEIWKAQQARKGTATQPVSEKVIDMTGPSVARPGPARRMDDGALYVKAVDRGTKADLSEEAKLLIGDPKSGTQYGNVTYRIDGDTVLVDNVGAADYLTDKSEVIHDALVELGAQHPGMSIEWTPATPELEAIRDRLVSENPQGRDAGLQWFTPESDLTQTRRAAVVGKAIRESFKTLSDDEVQSATSIVYETARSLGFRPEDVVGKSLELTTLDEIQKRPELAAQLAEARGGMAAAQTERGATLFTQDGQMVGLSRASKEFERGMKAVIYAAENANFSTFSHEWFHFIDVAYIGRSEKHRGLFEEALGKRYDDLTTDDREQLAYSFEQYLQSGKAPTSALKDLFKRIARAMTRAISALGRTMTISPQLKKGYDALFQSDSQLKRDSSTESAGNAPDTREAVQIPAQDEEPGKVAPERIGRAPGPVFERRNISLRDKLVEDMNSEERAQALLLNELTVIPNRRAYADDNRKRGSPYPVQVSIDADSLKWINDHLGHAAGDAQLITIADALKDAADNHGVLAYHVSGDEYIIQGENLAAVKEAIAEAEKTLSASRLSGDLDLVSGAFEVEGFRFTYGINEKGDLKDADQKMEEAKRGKESRGERAPRGELPPNIRISSNTGRVLNAGEVRELFQERNAGSNKDAGQAKGSDRGIVFQEADPTDSEAFKEWFGDSKVVDGDGHPLVVYHWTGSDITQFDNAKLGAKTGASSAQLGFFFAEKSIAKSFGPNLFPVYLKMDNPYHVRADEFQELLFGADEKKETQDSAIEALGDHIDRKVIYTWEGPATYDGEIDRESLDEEGQELFDNIIEVMNRDDRDDSDYYGKDEKYFKEWRAQLESDGYDGIIVDSQEYHSNWERAEELDSDNFIVFSPTQIKSVNNRGTWDASDPRILFQEADPPESTEFKAWFKESKVVDENGAPKVVYHGTSEKGLEGGAFKKEYLGSVTKSKSAKAGFFFVDDRDAAAGYSDLANKKPVQDLIAASEAAERRGQWDKAADLMAKAERLEQESNPERHVEEVYLSLQNPFEYDADEQRFLDVEDEIHEAIEEATSGEYDGLIIHNLIDNADWGSDRVADHYVVFEPTQAKSINNRGTWSKDDPRILFQLTDPEIDDEARSYDSWEAWRDDVEATSSWMDTAKPEGLTGAEADAWYKSRWEAAHAIQRDEQGKEVEDIPSLTSEEIHQKLVEKIGRPGNLEGFLQGIYDARQADEAYGPEDEDERLAREEAQDLRSRIEEAHPTILNNAVRVGYSGKPLTAKARATIMTLIERGAPYYLRLYTDITGDQEFASLIENEEKTLPEIEDDDGPRISIVDRMKLRDKIKNEEIRKKILTGELVPEEVRGYIESLDKEKSDLSARLRAAEKEIEEDRSTFTTQERIFTEQREKIADLKKEIERNTREITSVEEKLAQVRAREKTGKSAYALHVEQVKIDERAKRKTAENSAAARRQKLAASYEKKLDTLRSTLQEQREEYKTLRTANREALSSARAEASLQKRTAINDLKAEIRAKEEERREAAKVIQLKRKIVAHILQKPSKAIWYEYAEKIRAIQRTVDPQARKATVKWEGEVYEIQAFREKALNEGIVDILPKGMVKRLFSKSLDEWTIAELEEMSAEIDHLRTLGRQEWALKEAERKHAQYLALKEGIAQHSEDPAYTGAAAAGSKERREELKKLDSGFRKIATATWTLSRIADWLDGGEKGVHTRLLVDEEREAYKVKMDNYDRRVNKINTLMKEKGISIRDLYEKEHTIEGIGPTSKPNVTLSSSDLMYMHIGLRDANTREAILYGVLMDQEDRSNWDNATLRVMGREKLQALESFIQVSLTQDEKAIAEAIGKDFNDEYERLDDIFLNEFNLKMKKVSSYVPMIRQDVTASGEQHEAAQADELLNVAGVSIKRTPDKGFTAQRVKISPRGQRAIKLDLYGTWMDATERQEHFAAYTRYIRKLNGVYKNTMDSRSRLLRHMITQTKGPEVLKRVDAEINALANPQSFRDDRNMDRMVRALRGNLGSAYLAWKTSSILKQAVTSPAPFLSYVNPLDMASSAIEYASDPRAMDEAIRSKSAIMRHRVSNPILEAIHRARKESKGAKGLAWIRDLGMKGLEAVDWVSVATGWNAVYKKALLEGATEEEAVAKADDITLKCQPSAREQDLAPLFKGGGEIARVLTQFQTALNVIWNQFSYDLPAAVKRKEWGFVVRMTTSYAIAGIALGLLTEGIRGDDDDKKRFAYWSFSQAFDSVPLIGSGISAVARQAITGEKERFYTSSLFPAAEELMSAAKNVTEKDWGGAAKDFAEGIGIGAGLPVSGVKEAIAAPEDPGRLIGRRK